MGLDYLWVGTSPTIVTKDCIHWYEVPEGVAVSEFMADFASAEPIKYGE